MKKIELNTLIQIELENGNMFALGYFNEEESVVRVWDINNYKEIANYNDVKNALVYGVDKLEEIAHDEAIENITLSEDESEKEAIIDEIIEGQNEALTMALINQNLVEINY